MHYISYSQPPVHAGLLAAAAPILEWATAGICGPQIRNGFCKAASRDGGEWGDGQKERWGDGQMERLSCGMYSVLRTIWYVFALKGPVQMPVKKVKGSPDKQSGSLSGLDHMRPRPIGVKTRANLHMRPIRERLARLAVYRLQPHAPSKNCMYQ